jgi:hypothetical protein
MISFMFGRFTEKKGVWDPFDTKVGGRRGRFRRRREDDGHFISFRSNRIRASHRQSAFLLVEVARMFETGDFETF